MEENGYKSLNLYKGVRGLSVKILNRIDRTDAYLDKMLDIELKNNELKANDKALLYEIVHGVIRYLGRIDWVLTGFYKGQFSKCIPNVKNSMRVALYQILFLDKVPDYAAVNEAVDFVKKLQGDKSANLTNAVLRNIIRNKDGIRYPKRDEDLSGYLSAYYSHPSWMVKRWLNRFGEDFTENLLKANNNRPTITLRINSLVSNFDEVVGLSEKVNLGYTKGNYLLNFIKLKNLSNISKWEYFHKGYISIQDESTGFSCYLLDPKPKERVLDLFAAPGGKTSLLADLMENKGEIIAIDKYESRLNLLKKNLERLSITNVKAIEADAFEFEDEEKFDKILLDVPCSGLGTISKKPDIKWRRDVSDIRKLGELQTKLLEKGASLLKPGGELVYSTCTIEPEENFDIIKKFLEKHKEFEIINAANYFDKILVSENGCVQTYPNIHGIDGAFAAKLKLKNE
ncbi:MAG: 16S rRNA (cytosine(967)-C(5))-methyltransferase RsmB [Melioribacteraceae bacterium]|nr:16S rRNA (cytosine(967)-C(5))-methyltransferase RsmB [Melioribacteraceae bacterium]